MKRVLFVLLVLAFLIPLALPAQEEVEESGGIYPSESQGEGTNSIDPNRQLLGNFENLPEQSFTKDLRINAQTQNETRPHYYVLEGYVDIAYKGLRLQADHAEYDTDTRDLIATGNVVLDQEDQRITGKRLELNLETKKGTMYDTFGFFPPQFFFWGKKLDKLGEQKYLLHDGVITECSQIVPHWQLNTHAATMNINSYVRFNGFTMKAKKIPFFYSPFMMWPIKRDRATGFLFPSFGPNSKKGWWTGGSFFWAMGDSMDSTYWLDHYSLRGWGGGTEYRYAESEESDGTVKYYYMNDRELGPQWTFSGKVNQELPWDLRLAGVVDLFSSYTYIRDYSNNLARSLTQTQTTQVFLTRNWSYYSMNFLGDWSQKQGGQGRNSQSSKYYHLPELQFVSRDQQIPHTPLFWNLNTSYDYLGNGFTTRLDDIHTIYSRYDLYPQIYWPINYLSWLTFTPTYSYRTTYYSKQLDPAPLGFTLDKPLTRTLNELTLDVRGPNFGKIFDTPSWGYSQKWKHAIEPEVTFNYRSNIPELDSIIITDGDIDGIFGRKEVTYSLTNYIYAKRPIKPKPDYKPYEYQYYTPENPEDAIDSPWEFLQWKLSQSYRFQSDSFGSNKFGDDEKSPFSDVRSDLRVNPTQQYSVEFDSAYNVQARQLTTIRLTTGLQSKAKWYSNVSYVYSNPVSFRVLPGQPRPKSGNSLQFNAGYGFKNNRFVIAGDAGFNLTDKVLLTSTLAFTFNEDCYSVGVVYKHASDFFRVNGKENSINFSVSLPNIGNLVSFQNGQSPKHY